MPIVPMGAPLNLICLLEFSRRLPLKPSGFCFLKYLYKIFQKNKTD